MIFGKNLSSAVSAFLAGSAALLGLGSPLAAQLQWETTQTHQVLELGQEKASAVFPFENTGAYPVEILSTSTSCGCTTAELSKTVYQPGEKGAITANFDVGSRTGSRRNTVRVFTDDDSVPSTTLTMAVEIPSLVTITPRLVQWRKEAAPEPKTIQVELNPEAGLEITGIRSDNENFEVALEKGETPHEFSLTITPLQTKSSERAVFSLQTEPKHENQPNFSFYAFVR